MKSLQATSVVVLVAAGLLVAGCAKDTATVTVYDPAAAKTAAIQRIENERFMPADQKAAALARLGVRPVYDPKKKTTGSP